MSSEKQGPLKGLKSRVARIRKARRRPVRLDGLAIPPASIRLGGHNFNADRDFLASAEAEAERLRSRLGAGPETHVLEIGCGVGRLPIGMLKAGLLPAGYVGVDVDAGSIGWCRRNVALPQAEFIHLDLANARYNPGGREIDEDLRLPLPASSFEIIYLYSVFSHMEAGDITAYLAEFERLLVPGGSVFLTAFVEDGVEDVAVNPAGYGDFPGEWSGELHCVRLDRGFFTGLVRDSGLEVTRIDHGTETDGQSGVYLERAPESPDD